MPDQIPSGSVIVTPDNMWQVIQETRDGVNELKTLMNPALKDIRDDVKSLDDREQKHHEEHASAISDLQKQSWSSKWVGPLISGTLVAAIGGIAVWVLTHVAVN